MHSPAYCTAADLIGLRICTEAELIDLTAPGTAGYNATTVAAACETAAIEIDPYLAGKTAVPLTAVPAPVTRLACILARYYLHSVPTEHVQRAYDAALRTLLSIARGEIQIGADVPAPATDDGPQFDAIAPVWGRDPDTGGLR